jgi:LmbE family N-acetylglucosaminyl deacetylase
MAANDPGQPLTDLGQIESSNLPTPAAALAIGAHPDDVEFGCGGLLAKWEEAGCRVHHLNCTDGSKGTWDVTADPLALSLRRRQEQLSAARILAGPSRGEVRFLDAVDGELDSNLDNRGRVAQVIRELRPDVVLGHDPWKRYRLHPDHRHAGILACEGIVAARDPHFFPEHHLPHHRPEALLLWEADAPNHVEDVSASVAVKLAALLAHESQFESTMRAVTTDELALFESRIRDRLAVLGEPFGMAAAEVFHLIDDL